MKILIIDNLSQGLTSMLLGNRWTLSCMRSLTTLKVAKWMSFLRGLFPGISRIHLLCISSLLFMSSNRTLLKCTAMLETKCLSTQI